MPSFGVASNAVPVHRAVGYSWRLLQLYLQYCTSLLATRPDGWRGCSRLIRLECTQWMTTRTLMMLVGLGPKSANEDLNVNETSIFPAISLSSYAKSIGARLTLGAGTPFAYLRTKSEPEAHRGAQGRSQTRSASDRTTEPTSIRKPCVTVNDMATVRCTAVTASS